MRSLGAGLWATALARGGCAREPDSEVRSRLKAIARAHGYSGSVTAKHAVAAEFSSLGGRTLEEVCEIALEDGPMPSDLDEHSVAWELLPIMAAGQQDRVRPCLLEAARGNTYWRVEKSIDFLVMLGDRGAVADLAELAARPIDGNPGDTRT